LEDLPAHLRHFLVGTCVLGRLSGPLCDQILGMTGGAQALRELERRQAFTYAAEDGGWYRYHEALRSPLEGLMLEELGADETRRRYRLAAALLEADGAVGDALQAYCRGEDWESAGRLLGSEGELLTGVRDIIEDAGGFWAGASVLYDAPAICVRALGESAHAVQRLLQEIVALFRARGCHRVCG